MGHTLQPQWNSHWGFFVDVAACDIFSFMCMRNPGIYRGITEYILRSDGSDAHVEPSRWMASECVYEHLWVHLLRSDGSHVHVELSRWMASECVYEHLWVHLLRSGGSDAHVELSKWSASVSIWSDDSTLICSHDADACMELQTASAAQNAQYNIRC